MANIFGFTDFSGLGTSNGLTLEQRIAATKGATQAAATGDLKLAQIYQGILKYGVPLLTGLVTAGVFKNKTQIEIARINAGALSDFKGLNSGVDFANTDPNALNMRSSNNPFGISNSTALLLVAGAVVYVATKK